MTISSKLCSRESTWEVTVGPVQSMLVSFCLFIKFLPKLVRKLTNYFSDRGLDPKEYVPEKFTSLLRFKLGRLVGKGVLDHSLVCLDFWVQLPNRLRQIGFYDERKRQKKLRDSLAELSDGEPVIIFLINY